MKIIGCTDERTVRDHRWLWKPLGNNALCQISMQKKLNVPVTLNSGSAWMWRRAALWKSVYSTRKDVDLMKWHSFYFLSVGRSWFGDSDTSLSFLWWLMLRTGKKMPNMRWRVLNYLSQGVWKSTRENWSFALWVIKTKLKTIISNALVLARRARRS